MRKTPTDAEVLLIGRLNNESVTTSIKSLGANYNLKMLSSSAANWEKIVELLERTPSNIKSILVKVTETDFHLAIRTEYKGLFGRLCDALVESPHAIFIYSDLLSEDFPRGLEKDWKDREWGDRNPYSPAQGMRNYAGTVETYKEELKTVRNRLFDPKLRVAPYDSLVMLNTSAQQFLEETTRGLLMRIYIPNDRLWANEIDKLLLLFTDYLRRVQQRPITLDQVRTARGMTYGFYSADGSISKDEISNLLEEFSGFLKLCANDPIKASEILRARNISDEQIQSIILKYTKEAGRLLLDIQHEQEAKLLRVRQRLESELHDIASAGERHELLSALDNAMGLRVTEPTRILETPERDDRFRNQVININNPQFISSVRGIVSQTITGDIDYNEQDEHLRTLFKSLASRPEGLELTSALDELKDPSVPQPQRTTAWQKIRAFLSQHATEIGSTTISILEKYIKYKLTGT